MKTKLINGANYLSGRQQPVTKYLVQRKILLLFSLTAVFKKTDRHKVCSLCYSKKKHHKNAVLEQWPNYFRPCKTKLIICRPNFVTLFKLFQAIKFQQSNRHLAAPFSTRYAQASPNSNIVQGLSLKGPGNGDFLELTRLGDNVWIGCSNHFGFRFKTFH